MAVTKETYTATPTWTASGLANIFKDAFIDAGLMTDWYDSFLNTVENRILEVVYDPSKTYGTVYYWFMFTTDGVYVQTALGWNAGTHVPTGTQYQTYFSTTTNATTNHRVILSLTNNTAVTLTRYTSAINTACSWFLIRLGTTHRAFHIPSPGFGPSSIVDLNKVAFNGMQSVSSGSSGIESRLEFSQLACNLRRTYLTATSLRAITTISEFQQPFALYRVIANGNGSGSSQNHIPSTLGLVLPNAMSNTHTGMATDHTPIHTGIPTSFYTKPMPGDFGFSGYYLSVQASTQDKIVVNAGVEEWEIITYTQNANASTQPGELFMVARIV